MVCVGGGVGSTAWYLTGVESFGRGWVDDGIPGGAALGHGGEEGLWERKIALYLSETVVYYLYFSYFSSSVSHLSQF